MNTNGNLNESVGDRLKKENAARGKIRNISLTNKNINRKLRITLFESLISQYIIIQSSYYPHGEKQIYQNYKDSIQNV